MQSTYRLFTFSLSHFSEKARWALSASGVPFQEEPWTPFFHAVPALRSGGRTTVPILEAGSRRVQDSTKILHFLNEHWGRLPVLPESEPESAEAWELENRFDRVGRHVVPFI